MVARLMPRSICAKAEGRETGSMRKFGLLLGLLALLAMAWTGAWFAAAHQATVALHGWIAGERAQGREWTCPKERVGGFPFALSVHCDHPHYAGRALGQTVEAGTTRLTATASLAHLRRLALRMDPPFTFRSSDGSTDLSAGWQSLTAEVGPLSDPRSLLLQSTGLDVTGHFAGTEGTTTVKADALDADLTMSQVQDDPTLDFDVSIKGTALPPVDALLGGTAPVDIAVGGRLDRAEFGDARTPEEALEHWRRAGGRVDIGHLLVTRANANASATGRLQLDPEHRLDGRLDAAFVGLGPIFARYGISDNLVAVTSILGALLGGGNHKAATAPGELDLPITFKNGRVGIGPLTTGVRLVPLY